MSRVVVATPEAGCAASLALLTEGVTHDEVVVRGAYEYGALLAGLWDAGKPFVLCEWDVIPSPGKVEGLLECPRSWCGHRYPLAPHNIAHSFGFNKFKPNGPSDPRWLETPWRMLDGKAVPFIRKRLGRVHIHEPAVAHARRG